MQKELTAVQKNTQYSPKDTSGDKLAPENPQNWTPANPPQQKTHLIEPETIQSHEFQDSNYQNHGEKEVTRGKITPEHPPQPPPTTQESALAGQTCYPETPPYDQPRNEEDLTTAGQSQSDIEFNNLIYEITLNQLILDSDDSDSEGTIRTNDTLRFPNSSDDNSSGSNEDRSKKDDGNQDGPKELTGCALYMKHGLIFKKNYRCGEQSCDICSESKLYYRKYVDRYGRETNFCAWDANKIDGMKHKF